MCIVLLFSVVINLFCVVSHCVVVLSVRICVMRLFWGLVLCIYCVVWLVCCVVCCCFSAQFGLVLPCLFVLGLFGLFDLICLGLV